MVALRDLVSSVWPVKVRVLPAREETSTLESREGRRAALCCVACYGHRGFSLAGSFKVET